MATTDLRATEMEASNILGDKKSLLAGIALCSFSALLLELGLTRLFSVVLFYHFAFLAISVALLGLGAGGVFAHLGRQWLSRWDARTLGSRTSALCSVSIVAVLAIVTHSAVHLTLSGKDFFNLSILYLASAVPFFLIGLLFSIVFARNAGFISLLYAADLAGGALACLATVPLLNYLGGPNTILCAALTMAIASMLWRKRRRWVGVSLAVLLVILITVNSFRPVIDILYAKGQRRGQYGVEYARWNAISRVEVDRTADGARYITIDSDASTAIMNVDPHHWEGTSFQRSLLASVPSVVNVLRPHGEFAIIGPGGGVDVLRAVASGSPKVTGIEINPIIVNDVMRGRFADFSYHLYQIPEVNVHVSDGRSFVRSSRDRYDVLQMTLVDTWASTAAGAFALSENNLYTVEAFKEYFEHLRADGMLAITRWEFKEPREALRVVSVAMEALHQLGVAEPAANFMVISDGALNSDGRPVLVLAKKAAFTADEQSKVLDHLRAHPNLVSQYLPSILGSNVFSELIGSNDPVGFAHGYKFNVAPVYDNAPFFFFNLKLSQVLKKGVTEGMDWKVNVGLTVLGIVLLLSLQAVLIFLILPLALRRGRSRERVLPLMYFVAVGLGYILIEIAFIQRFVLFLGHPTYALTVVIFLMLLSSGAGSFLSRVWLGGTGKVTAPLAVIVTIAIAYVFLLPVLLSSLVGLAFLVKLTISALLLVPLGLAMGMPFPMGLRALASTWATPARGNSVEWAWAMNAASSVLGSVLAMVIAIRFGLGVTLACGAIAYASAAVISGALRPEHA
jgi:spermidine synthase